MKKDTTVSAHPQDAAATPAAAHHHAEGLSSRASLERLKEGHKRFAGGKPQVHPALLWEEIKTSAKGQNPFAIVLACADSRVPPEIIFDQDVGDLFVLRVAGNVADTNILGSIQYALEHLGSKLIVVLGHERCGAIQAALASAAGKGGFTGPLGQLVSSIAPLVEPIQRHGHLASPPATDSAILDAAVRVNVKRQIAIIHEALENLGQEKITLELWLRQILVVGARYDLDDGTVEFFNEPPKDQHKRIGLLAEGGEGVAVLEGDYLYARPGQDFHEFELHEAGEGRFVLKSGINGKFVAGIKPGALCARASAAVLAEAQAFKLVDFGDRRYGLQTPEGHYLVLKPGSYNGILFATNLPDRVGGSQYFRIVEIDE